jgi:hypothetical protein
MRTWCKAERSLDLCSVDLCPWTAYLFLVVSALSVAGRRITRDSPASTVPVKQTKLGEGGFGTGSKTCKREERQHDKGARRSDPAAERDVTPVLHAMYTEEGKLMYKGTFVVRTVANNNRSPVQT